MIYLIRNLIISEYSGPKKSGDNQFAPLGVGVNELIVKILFLVGYKYE